MKSLRVFLISLLFVIAPSAAYPCIAPTIERWYMFSLCQDEFNDKFNRENEQFWEKYCGKEPGSWIYAEDRFNAAKAHKDAEMEKYLEALEQYTETCNSIYNGWEYPSAQEMAKYNATLRSVASTAEANLKSRKHAERWALLYMRANMALKQYQNNIHFWDKTARKFHDGHLKDMMYNIYANALLNTGRKREAWNIYAQQNDQQSLLWSVRKFTNLAGIKQIYAEDPNAPVLGYLLQTYINMLQDCVDNGNSEYNDYDWRGEAYAPISEDYRQEMRQFCQFALEVAKGGKTSNPAMWQTAAALVNYYMGNYTQAYKEIETAMDMKGTPDTMKMARRIRMLIATAAVEDVNDTEFKQFMANELRWLSDDIKQTGNIYAYNAMDRILNLGLAARYKQSHPFMAIALQYLRSVYDGECAVSRYGDLYSDDEIEEYFTYKIGQDHSSEGFRMLFANNADNIERYFNFARNHAGDPLATFIFEKVKYPGEYINDITGTKYLYQMEFDKALNLLQQVPVEYLAKQSIAPYAASRDYRIPAWYGFQTSNDNAVLTRNVKADFCRDLLDLKNKFENATGAERERLLYQIASRLYQASSCGQCWYLTDYSWSEYKLDPQTDTWMTNYKDNLADYASRLIDTLSKCNDKEIHGLALFAKAYMAPDTWVDYDWDYKLSKYVCTPIRSSQQFKDYGVFCDYIDSKGVAMPADVRRCDVLKQFRKYAL